MIVKNISIEELKKDYSARNGFVFFAAADCDSKTCEEAAIGIKKRGFTTETPEFVGQINARTFAFVYAEGVSFDCPNFLDFCSHWSMMTGAFRVDALAAWLKEQP
jgi:hypothetical protein